MAKHRFERAVRTFRLPVVLWMMRRREAQVQVQFSSDCSPEFGGPPRVAVADEMFREAVSEYHLVYEQLGELDCIEGAAARNAEGVFRQAADRYENRVEPFRRRQARDEVHRYPFEWSARHRIWP